MSKGEMIAGGPAAIRLLNRTPTPYWGYSNYETKEKRLSEKIGQPGLFESVALRNTALWFDPN